MFSNFQPRFLRQLAWESPYNVAMRWPPARVSCWRLGRGRGCRLIMGRWTQSIEAGSPSAMMTILSSLPCFPTFKLPGVSYLLALAHPATTIWKAPNERLTPSKLYNGPSPKTPSARGSTTTGCRGHLRANEMDSRENSSTPELHFHSRFYSPKLKANESVSRHIMASTRSHHPRAQSFRSIILRHAHAPYIWMAVGRACLEHE